MAVHQTNILLETETNEVEILEFYIDEEGYRGCYGVNVAKVLEIIPFPTKIVRPPNARAGFVAGIFNNWDPQPDDRMWYDEEIGHYVRHRWLLRGAYDYQYVVGRYNEEKG